MSLQKRLKKARGEKIIRPDNDPDLCKLQALWVEVYGSEDAFEPVYQAFRMNPDARLDDYIRQYKLSVPK